MSKSGSLNTTAYNNRYLTFTWNVTSQNVANNTTTISWRLVGAGSASGYYETRNIKVTIDGSVAYSTGDTNPVKLYSGTVVASGTKTFTHADNGAKSFNVRVEAGIYVWAVNSTGAVAFELDVIPRKSTLTASNGTLGIRQVLTVTRKATTFTHTIEYKCGTASGVICSNVTDESVSWTPGLDLASQAPAATSVSVALTITTLSGGKPIGSETVTITCGIQAAKCVPVLLPSVSDAMGYASTYGAYVQGQSALKVDINTYGVYGAWITSVKTTFDGSTYTETESLTTNVIKGSGELKLSITVTDSRGLTSTSTATINVLAYEYPKITELSAVRCNQDGTPNPSGTHIRAKFSAKVTPLNNKNKASYYVGYKKVTEENHTAVLQDDLADTYTVSGATYVFPAETASSYTVILSVIDAFHQSRTTTTGTSAKQLWSLLKKNGEIVGIAFNKIAEYENVFDIGMPVRFSGGGDTVVEQGELNGWTYRKWDSGVAECWKIHEFSTTINTAFGSLYCGNATERQTYPFSFVEKPVENVTLQSGSTQAFLYVETGGHGVNGTSASARYNVFRPGAMTANQTFYLSFHVIGKWK